MVGMVEGDSFEFPRIGTHSALNYTRQCELKAILKDLRVGTELDLPERSWKQEERHDREVYRYCPCAFHRRIRTHERLACPL